VPLASCGRLSYPELGLLEVLKSHAHQPFYGGQWGVGSLKRLVRVDRVLSLISRPFFTQGLTERRVTNSRMTKHRTWRDDTNIPCGGYFQSPFDAFQTGRRRRRRFENSATGFRALRKWLGRAPNARDVF